MVIMNIPSKQVLRRHLGAAKNCNRVYYNKLGHNLQLIINPFGRTVHLTVKGTSTTRHWQNNLMVGVNDRQAHKGFWKYAKECVDEIREQYPEMSLSDIYPGGKLILSGHSSGSCALTICLYEMMRNDLLRNIMKNWRIELVMFGSPRPGKEEFVKEFDELLEKNRNVTVYRYEVQMDIASTFPPIPGYMHVGGNHVLMNNVVLGDPYGNHSITNYIRNIELAIENYEDFICASSECEKDPPLKKWGRSQNIPYRTK